MTANDVILCESSLSQERFARNYLTLGVPVLVVGGVKNWPATSKWSLDYFARIFDGIQVALQGDFFGDIATVDFLDYIEMVRSYEDKPLEDFKIDRPVPYLRYSQFRKIAHKRLTHDWFRPDFLPLRGYTRPVCVSESKPHKSLYPEFGVYVSPRGASTRLHVDPGQDNAVLCQVRGRKCGFLYSPDQKEHWKKYFPPNPHAASATRKAVAVLGGELASMAGLRGLKFDLNEGDVLFIPKGWAHEVYTLSASISVTYNFLHFSDYDLGEHLWVLGNTIFSRMRSLMYMVRELPGRADKRQRTRKAHEQLWA